MMRPSLESALPRICNNNNWLWLSRSNQLGFIFTLSDFLFYLFLFYSPLDFIKTPYIEKKKFASIEFLGQIIIKLIYI